MRIYIFFIFILAFGIINLYIGKRGWHSLFKFLPRLNSKLYWIVFWLVAWSYIVSMFGHTYLPKGIENVLIWVGSYWLAAMYYFFLFLIIIDLIRLIDKYLGFLPDGLKYNPRVSRTLSMSVFLLVIVILLYGSWNARNPQIHHYDVTIPKQAGSFQELHVVMVSDIHLGKIINCQRLQKMITMINGLKPDLILIAGDIIDSDINPLIEQEITDSFSKLQPPLGIYAVLGNHEYISGLVENFIYNLENNRIRVLRDEYVKVADSFYIIGRDELSSVYYNGQKRQELSALTSNVDRDLPIILLDHEPSHLDDAQKLGVDLQLSGHTHRGQLFPNNLITQYIYEIDWGYLVKDSLQIIVSSGFGTWGPPIRVGNRPEIVDLDIHFANSNKLK